MESSLIVRSPQLSLVTVPTRIGDTQSIGATHVVPEIGPIKQGVERGLAPNELQLGKPRIQDLGLYGVETFRGQRYRYQTPLNLLIYRSLFGNDERVTDSL